MKYREFENEIKAAYAAKFNKSICLCVLNTTLGGYISIDCYLAGNTDEFPHRIAENDAISVKLNIDLPQGWKHDDELPKIMTLEALKNSIKHKPPKEEDYFYCKYTKVSFRKTTGDAEKIIKVFKKFVDRLYNAISEQYDNNNLLPDDMKLFKNKYAECIIVPFTSAGMIGGITVKSGWDGAEDTAKQLRRGGRKVKMMSRTEFTELQEKEAKERTQC